MDDLGKVSIIIPVYNVENYLEECLDSAVFQDYPNIEIIAVNDGSTDNSLSIINKYEDRYFNIISRSIHNQGAAVARNTGLDMASGEYVFFLDSDDKIELNAISLCIQKLDHYQTDIVFFSAVAFCDGVDAFVKKEFQYQRAPSLQNKVIPSRTFFHESIFIGNYMVQPSLYMYRLKKLKRIRFHPGLMLEDNLFTTRLLVEYEDVKVVCINDALFNRRLRPNSIMTQKKSEKHINAYIITANELLKYDFRHESADVRRAMDYFIQEMILHALRSCRVACDNHFPIALRKESLLILKKVNIKHIQMKCLASCLIPELLIMKEMLKREKNESLLQH